MRDVIKVNSIRKGLLLWYKDTGQHVYGEFSMAVVQVNQLLEDQSEIESGSLSLLDSGPHGTFVGVYGGSETSLVHNEHLFQQLMGFSAEQHCMSIDEGFFGHPRGTGDSTR